MSAIIHDLSLLCNQLLQAYLITVDICTDIFEAASLSQAQRQIAPFLHLLLQKMICHDMVFYMPDNLCVMKLRIRARDAVAIQLSPLLQECLDTVSPVSEDQIHERIIWRAGRTISAMSFGSSGIEFPM